MSYNRRSEDFNAEKLANELTNIYEKVSEACEMFDKGLHDNESRKLLPLARGLCFFQQGSILESIGKLYSPTRHTQKDLDDHTKLILEDFELAQREFKKAKNMQGVLLSIEHRSQNDTIRQKSYNEYHKMKLDSLKRLHPTMKRADSNIHAVNFLNSFVMHQQQTNSARDRRNTTNQ